MTALSVLVLRVHIAIKCDKNHKLKVLNILDGKFPYKNKTYL